MNESVPLAEVIADARPGFACGEIDQNGIVQVRMNNVSSDGALVLDSLRRVPRDAGDFERFRVEVGDVLFNATNSPELVGKSALFRGYVEPIVYSNHFLRLRPVVHRLDSGYLSRWLHMLWLRGDFTRMCKQWVNQASVASDRLLALEIPLPPLPEQRRMAAILDKADELRAKRQATLERLSGLTQAIFLEMFGDPTTNPKGFPIGNIERLVKNPKGDIRCGPFGTQLKVHEITSEGIPLFGIENVLDEGFNARTSKFLTDVKAKQLKAFDVAAGDVLVTRMGTIGRACVVPPTVVNGRFSYHL